MNKKSKRNHDEEVFYKTACNDQGCNKDQLKKDRVKDFGFEIQ